MFRTVQLVGMIMGLSLGFWLSECADQTSQLVRQSFCTALYMLDCFVFGGAHDFLLDGTQKGR